MFWEFTADSDNYDRILLVDQHDVGFLIDHFNGQPMAHLWRPLPVYIDYKEGRATGDFPSFYGTVPAFSERALNVLGTLIANSVEILPLQCGEEKIFAINVIDVVDCLDRERSEYETFSNGAIMSVTHYVFKDGCLEGRHIFKLSEPRVSVYVSDAFRAAVETHGLKGLSLKRTA